MNQEKFDKLIDAYLHKMKIIDNTNVNKSQFQLSNDNLVSCKIDLQELSVQKKIQIKIPKFVDRVYIGRFRYVSDSVARNMQIDTFSSTHDFGQQFLSISSLHITGDGAIFPGQYRQISIIDSLDIVGNIPYIGSYSLCVSGGCSVDIQKLNDCKIDSRFLSVKRVNGVAKKAKIICNKQQYNAFMHDKNFKYQNMLVLNEQASR